MPPARLAGKEKIIAVLGAGFGGLRAATLIDRGLRRKRIPGYRVALIDRNEYHTYTPLLYETATISKETANICEIREIVAYRFARLLLCPTLGPALGHSIEECAGEFEGHAVLLR